MTCALVHMLQEICLFIAVSYPLAQVQLSKCYVRLQ